MYSIKNSLDIIIYYTDIQIKKYILAQMFKALKVCANNFELIISTIHAFIFTSNVSENVR